MIRKVTTATLLFLFFLAAGASTILFADANGPRTQRKVKLVLPNDEQATEIDVEGLALGESREVTSDSGHTIKVTRTQEDRLEVAVDGKTISLPTLDEPEGEGNHRVIVRHEKGGESTEGEPRVKKVIRVETHGHGEEGEDGVKVLTLDGADLDCETDEACEAAVRELMSEHAHGDGDVIVIKKKRVSREGEEAGEDEADPR